MGWHGPALSKRHRSAPLGRLTHADERLLLSPFSTERTAKPNPTYRRKLIGVAMISNIPRGPPPCAPPNSAIETAAAIRIPGTPASDICLQNEQLREYPKSGHAYAAETMPLSSAAMTRIFLFSRLVIVDAGCSKSSQFASPRFLKNAGTSRSACSKLAIMALRMPSNEMTSAAGAGRGASMTMGGGAGSEPAPRRK